MATNSSSNIPTGAINTVLQGGGVGSASVFTPLKVVQTVVINATAGSATNSLTLVDVTGATLSITPTSASNKILVMINWAGYIQAVAANNGANLPGFFRDAVQLNTAGNIQIASPLAAGGVGCSGSWCWSQIDSPATTSSTTYKMKHRTSNAAVTATSIDVTIILMEIVA